MNDAPKRGVLRLVLPGLVLLGMGGLLLYASGGSSIACAHEAGGARCVVARRVLRLVDVPLRRVSEVQGIKMQERRVPYEDGHDDYTVSHPYLVTPRGLVSFTPPGVHGADSEAVSRVDAFCKDKGAAPLSLHHQPGRAFALDVLGALLVLWGASLVLEALRAVVTGRPSRW